MACRQAQLAQSGLVLMIVTELGAPAGRTCRYAPSCHWKMNAAACPFSPSESNFTGPSTLLSVTPLCRYLMIAELSVPLVAVTACCTTWPTEYASATSALMSDGVPPYLAMYAFTIDWLAAFR